MVQIKGPQNHVCAHFIVKLSPGIFQVSVMHRILLMRTVYG
jgi:hypothetical protein